MERASATDASAISVEGLPDHDDRSASERRSASWAAAMRRATDVERLRARLGPDRGSADGVLVAGLPEHEDLVAPERLG